MIILRRHLVDTHDTLDGKIIRKPAVLDVACSEVRENGSGQHVATY